MEAIAYMAPKPSGLYYLQSRYYNPEIGRFINADAFTSTGQGLLGNNMFAYCGNNSVCFADPTGHSYDPTIIRNRFFTSEITHSFGGKMTVYPSGIGNEYSEIAFYDIAYDTSISLATSAVAISNSFAAVALTVLDGVNAYFYSRDAGLDPLESACGVGISIATILIPLPKDSTLLEAVLYDSALSFSAVIILENYVSCVQNDPVAAGRNRSQFRSNLGAAICVGGSMKYSSIYCWDTGGDMFAWF